MAFSNATTSRITWSAGKTSNNASSRFLYWASSAAKAIAGAVLRPCGSSRILAWVTPISCSCWAIRKRWSSLQTTIGALTSSAWVRFAVCCNKLYCSSVSGRHCLGKCSRDKGHSRLPTPPDKITGIIFTTILYQKSNSHIQNNKILITFSSRIRDFSAQCFNFTR